MRKLENKRINTEAAELRMADYDGKCSDLEHAAGLPMQGHYSDLKNRDPKA